MKIYCKITKELFGFINFELPQFRFFPGEVKFAIVKYCYVFPQKVNTWSESHRIETMYYFLFFRLIVSNRNIDELLKKETYYRFNKRKEEWEAMELFRKQKESELLGEIFVDSSGTYKSKQEEIARQDFLRMMGIKKAE